jgi:hypothetical protein
MEDISLIRLVMSVWVNPSLQLLVHALFSPKDRSSRPMATHQCFDRDLEGVRFLGAA